MSRLCGSTETLDGQPCSHLVDDSNDHCAAHHFCPPVVASVASLGTPIVPVAFDFDLIAAPAEPTDEEKEIALAAMDLGRGIACAEQLQQFLGVKAEYLNTVRGIRNRISGGTAMYFLDRVAMGPLVFGIGVFGNPGIHVERACTMPGCTTPSWVRLEVDEQGKSHEMWERRAAFKASIDAAMKKEPQCHNHRVATTEMVKAQMAAEMGTGKEGAD